MDTNQSKLPARCKPVIVVWEDAAIDLSKSGRIDKIRAKSSPAIRYSLGWYIGNEVTIMWCLDYEKGKITYEYEWRIPKKMVRAIIPLEPVVKPVQKSGRPIHSRKDKRSSN